MTRARGRMNNAFDPGNADALDPHTRELVAAHAASGSVPPTGSSTTDPIHVVRGRGSRLWDADGNEYLDAYNNVVSVGHAHPRVVEAVAAQMRDAVHAHPLPARGRSSTTPSDCWRRSAAPRAGTLMFTCTGSEANDLAMRIAKHRTGRDGVIVTSEAYHGNSDLTAELSPSLGEQSPLGTWVRQVPAPDSTGADSLGGRRRARGRSRTSSATANGLAAFIVDSAFSLRRHLRAPDRCARPGGRGRATGRRPVHRRRGAVRLRPRSATRLWGYQRHGVDPDIVTLGKPMGNGFPVAGARRAPRGRRRLRARHRATSTPSAATRWRSPPRRPRST